MKSSMIAVLFAVCGVISASSRAGYQELANGNSYKIYSESSTWFQARSTCALDGAHLAVINTEEEFQLVSRFYFLVAATSYPFLGFHGLYLNQEYVTVFDESLSKLEFHRWNAGYPLTSSDNQCGTLGANVIAEGIETSPCNGRSYFICELPSDDCNCH